MRWLLTSVMCKHALVANVRHERTTLVASERWLRAYVYYERVLVPRESSVLWL